MRGGVENHHTSHYPPALRFPLSLRAPTAPVSCGVAFAMAINKPQSQSLERAGLFLPRPVFSHGQLYVAFSRPGYLPSASKGVRVVVVEVEGAQGNLKGPDGGGVHAQRRLPRGPRWLRAKHVSMRKNRLQGCARLTQPTETSEPSTGPHASRLDPRPKGPKYLQVRTREG